MKKEDAEIPQVPIGLHLGIFNGCSTTLQNFSLGEALFSLVFSTFKGRE